MKIGIDLHGVLDANPKFFVDLSAKVWHPLVETMFDGEVHIITGMPWSVDLHQQLLGYGKHEVKWWSHFFSITDFLAESDLEFELDEKGRKSFPDGPWDSCKATYCSLNKIDIMYDDSPTYGKYFGTPYVLYQHSAFEKRKTYNKKELFN